MAIRCIKCMKEHVDGISKCPYCGFIEGSEEDEQCYLPPRTVLKGRYMIGSCLGSGGFGVTYVAWDSLLEKKVAIKEYLPSELATRTVGETRITVHDTDCIDKYEKGKRSFIEESRRLAKFNSVKGIVSIFDCFDENDTAYLVMECLEGKTLQQLIKEKKKIPFREALPIFVDVLEALEIVHAEGMMHRDIAPDNIFICNDGTAKLIDFGAARFMTTTHSRSLSMILKIGYAPIEQYTKHGNQGPWTDIYAVAASLYNAVTGIVPPDSYDRVEEDKMKNPSSLARKLPKHAETAMLNALNIMDANRTQSAKQFADELKGDIDVARIREKIKHEDTGRIAKWMKYAAAGFAAAIAAFGIFFVASGGNLFRSDNYDMPDGMARVPYVINDFVSDADVKLVDNELHMVISDRVTDSYFDNNYVLLQNPRSGNVAYKGSVVNVTASMKPDEYFIPDLSNYSKDYAVQILEAAGFDVRIEEGISETAAPGTVIAQNPLGNTIVFEGSEVTLTINKNSGISKIDMGKRIKTPDYIGKKFNDAQQNAFDLGLYMIITRSEYSDTIPAGEIIDQSPLGGETTYFGNTINVTVSLGKRTIIVPNLVYLKENEAIEKAENRLLKPVVKYIETTTVEEGLVIEQVPASGVSIYEGGEVTIYVSSGYKVKVPDVTGKDIDEAKNILSQNRLGYAVTLENSDTIPEGTVISQSEKVGDSVIQGTVVNLVVSAGKNVINVTGVSLNKSSLTLEYGEKYTMVATITPKNATTTAVTWSSSNSSVATVNSVGVVTAKGVGTTTIRVKTKDGEFTDVCEVTVVKVLNSLKVTSKPDKTSYYLGDSKDFSGLVVTAAYSDGSTENVTKTALISGFDSSTSGDKTIPIQYTYNGKTLSTSFSVHIRRLDRIEVDTDNLSTKIYKIGAGSLSLDGLKVTAVYDDGNRRDVTDSVKANRDKCVTGFSSKKSGKCTITVIYTDGVPKTASFDVIIQGDLVIKLNGSVIADQKLDYESEFTVSVECTNDSELDLSKVTWKSSNDAVKVEGSGANCKVISNGIGKAVLTATDENGAIASVTIRACGPWTNEYDTKSHEGDSSFEYASGSWTEYQTCKRTGTRHKDYHEENSSSASLSISGWNWWYKDDISYWGDWGATQGPLDYNPGSSDSRKVWDEQQLVKAAWSEITGYTYWHYRGTGGGTSCMPSNISSSSYYEEMTTGTSDKLLDTGKDCLCHSYRIYTKSGVANSSVAWWYGETPIIVDHPAEYKTVYYYQDRPWVTLYCHHFWKWSDWDQLGDWGAWSDWTVGNPPEAGVTVSEEYRYEIAVNTRTGYKFRQVP